MKLLALLLLAIVPRDDEMVRETVDLAERNFFYDDEGRLVFEQLIFYDWSEKAERYQVRAWRLIKDPSHVPTREPTGGYRVLWTDGDALRCVYSRAYRESWTQWDVELKEREILEKELRRPLRERPASVQSRRSK